jgi:hypothetical protein
VVFGLKTKEMRMNVMDNHDAIREKANQMGGTLWSLAVAATVGYVLWTSGSAIPWWVYPILFVQSLVGFAQMLFDEPGTATVDLADSCPIDDANEDAAPWPRQGVPAE